MDLCKHSARTRRGQTVAQRRLTALLWEAFFQKTKGNFEDLILSRKVKQANLERELKGEQEHELKCGGKAT